MTMTTLSDDHVLPFAIKPLGVRGRLVRLGSVAQDIVSKHNYPDVVSSLVAESVALTALLGTALKFDGKFILQTKTDGPVPMVVADFASPGSIRGMAKFNGEGVASLELPQQKDLLGKGYLAMTVDQGQDMERYQGIVSLDEGTLTDATHQYFLQSEQIPTRLRVAAGSLLVAGDAHKKWRAGAILIQHIPSEGGISMPEQTPEGLDPDFLEDDNWVKARALLDTVEDHELLDPNLTSEELLYRLFHEDGVTVYPTIPLQRHCTCSHEAVESMLRNFGQIDRTDMVKDGAIEVVCEFCSTPYRFNAADWVEASF